MTNTVISRFAMLAVGLTLGGTVFVTPAFASTNTNGYQLICNRYDPSCMQQQFNYQYYGSTNNYNGGYNTNYNNGNYGYTAPMYGYQNTPVYGNTQYQYQNINNGNYTSYPTYGASQYYPVTTIYGTQPSSYNYQYQYQYQYNATPAYSYQMPYYNYSTPSYNYGYHY